MHGQSHVTFLNFSSSHVLVIGEARHFQFCVLIDIEEYEYMHDNYSQKGCAYEESRELSKFWEISDNISETVNTETYSCNGRLI